jgi:hypothetical protein
MDNKILLRNLIDTNTLLYNLFANQSQEIMILNFPCLGYPYFRLDWYE